MDIKAKFGTSNQAITITLASLANNSARASTVIDNSSNLFLDALVQLHIRSGSGVSASGYVSIYVYGTADGGSNYTEGATGSDAAITLTVPPNAKLIGIINIVASTTTYKAGPFNVAAAFSGVLPEKWGIIVENKTGAALDSTEGNHAKFYQGWFNQV
jgi:hypothetical protein